MCTECSLNGRRKRESAKAVRILKKVSPNRGNQFYSFPKINDLNSYTIFASTLYAASGRNFVELLKLENEAAKVDRVEPIPLEQVQEKAGGKGNEVK